MFNSALDLGLNHDAYTAAISNPQPDLSVDSIKRMVYALVERGELAQLLALPWAGVVQLEKRGIREPVPVVQVSCCRACKDPTYLFSMCVCSITVAQPSVSYLKASK